MPFLLILVAVMLFSDALHAEDEADAAASSVEYLALEPKFVVNLQGRRKYMRAAIQLMIKGHQHVETIRTNQPAYRHALIMLFSRYKAQDLETVEQREALREKALGEVRKALDKYANSDGLRDLFFTEFLIQ